MSQNTLLKTALPQPLLSLNIRSVNHLFPGFTIGDFAAIYGSSSVLSLTSLLCVRAQLPLQLGGLGGNVVFLDGGNTFRLYQVARLARLYQLDPKKILENIYISRAFTVYQMTALILKKLKEEVKNCNAKLAIISDIAGFFLDRNVPKDEAYRIYSQITKYLSNFAKENQIVLVATYPPHQEKRRNNFLRALTCSRANTVMSIKQTKYDCEVVLEKHPQYISGVAEFPFENLTLTDFIEA